MATQQQALLLDTIVAMKKAVKRKAYESDSDSSVEQNTNRGHKLLKRARFVRKGNLAPAMAPAAYKEIVEHAGYQRAVINRNPPLIDDEGYEIDSDDNDDRVQEAMADAADANPYSSVHIEQIFAPLTSVTDLPNHPTLSRPFTSQSLTKLTVQGRDLMHKENKALWKVKPLLTRLQGDHTWAPCGMMIEPTDVDLFADELFVRYLARPAQASTAASVATPMANGEGVVKAITQSSHPDGSVPTAWTPQPKAADSGVGAEKEQPDVHPSNATEAEKDNKPAKDTDEVRPTSLPPDPARTGEEPRTNGTSSASAPKGDGEAPKNGPNPTTSKALVLLAASDEAAVKMADPTTSTALVLLAASDEAAVKMADAPDQDHPMPIVSYHGSNANPSRAASITTSAAADDLFIHPLFLAPRSSRPDRDQGLPDQEAEDVRRLLQLYVQKQEEVCRGTKKLYEGLLRADRYRKTVLKWAKAEAHRGELSDGEDWYDREEWGLGDDLKKGQDEEEEDTAQTQKKTRNRR